MNGKGLLTDLENEITTAVVIYGIWVLIFGININIVSAEFEFFALKTADIYFRLDTNREGCLFDSVKRG